MNVIDNVFGTGEIGRMLFKGLFDIPRDNRNRAQRRGKFMSGPGGQGSKCFDFITVGLKLLHGSDLFLLLVQFVGQPSHEVNDDARARSKCNQQSHVQD